MIALVVRALERGCNRIRKRLVWRELLDRPWGFVHVPPRHAMSQTAAGVLSVGSFSGIDRSTAPASLASWRNAPPITLEDVREGFRRAWELSRYKPR